MLTGKFGHSNFLGVVDHEREVRIMKLEIADSIYGEPELRKIIN